MTYLGESQFLCEPTVDNYPFLTDLHQLVNEYKRANPWLVDIAMVGGVTRDAFKQKVLAIHPDTSKVGGFNGIHDLDTFSIINGELLPGDNTNQTMSHLGGTLNQLAADIDNILIPHQIHLCSQFHPATQVIDISYSKLQRVNYLQLMRTLVRLILNIPLTSNEENMQLILNTVSAELERRGYYADKHIDSTRCILYKMIAEYLTLDPKYLHRLSHTRQKSLNSELNMEVHRILDLIAPLTLN